MRPTADHARFDDYLAAVRAYSRDVLIPAEPRLEAEGCVPDDILAGLKRLGLFAISIPESYGGLECTMEEQVLLTFEFTYASSVYRSRFSTTIGLTSQAILDFGTEAQKRRWLPGMAAGDITGAFSLTEPNAGSDAGAVETTARRDGDGWVLDGHKRYITNAPDAELFLVMARTDPDQPGARGVSAFTVPAGTPGIRPLPPSRLLGQEGSRVSEIEIRDCRVPADALLGGVEGRGLSAALRGINHARLHVAATCVGQGLRLIDESLAHVRERRQFGQTLGEFQLVQGMLAESRAEVAAAKALVLECAREFDRAVAEKHALPFVDIACAKYFASEMVSRVADRAVQVHGGLGYMADTPVARLWRDCRLFRIFEGASQVQQVNIAKAMLRGE